VKLRLLIVFIFDCGFWLGGVGWFVRIIGCRNYIVVGKMEEKMETTTDFLSSTSSGKHMICDFRGVRNLDLLNSVEGIQALLDSICMKYQYQVLARSAHAFHPIGVTVLYMLSESHISVHTFPERGYVAFDIYTCREMKTDCDYRDIYGMLMEAFNCLGCNEEGVLGGPVILDRSFV